MEWGLIGVLVIVCCGLFGMLVQQQRFYSTQVKDLVDRLMSRSLVEYEKAKNPPPPRVTLAKQEVFEDFDRILG